MEVEDQELRDKFDCPICHEIVSGRIVQCPRGHLFCESCLSEYIAHTYKNTGENKVQCPICRAVCDGENLIYNTMAKNMISKLKKSCTNDGCGRKISFVTFKDHTLICPHRVMQCKYSAMGCPWTGKFSVSDGHSSKCMYKTGFELAMDIKGGHEKFETLSKNITKRMAPLEQSLSRILAMQSKLSLYITMKERARIEEIYSHRRLMMSYGTPYSVQTVHFPMFNFKWEIGIEELKRDGDYGLYMKRISEEDEVSGGESSSTHNPRARLLPPVSVIDISTPPSNSLPSSSTIITTSWFSPSKLSTFSSTLNFLP